jgi:hypothetical protein
MHSPSSVGQQHHTSTVRCKLKQNIKTVTEQDNLIGFYASFNAGENQEEKVRSYLWGEKGLKEKLKSLKWKDYGTDFKLILFQIYTNPILFERQHLKEIENYRRKEKSIGIPVIIDQKNFFKLNESDRQEFFRKTIQKRLDLLNERVNRNKLDLDIVRLKKNIDELLN